jgi:hypothetical protein
LDAALLKQQYVQVRSMFPETSAAGPEFAFHVKMYQATWVSFCSNMTSQRLTYSHSGNMLLKGIK